jgi:DNA (cytosine-5)-methyltransferase 1
MRLTVGSLFSGIGGMDLGLERAGMTISWQVEIDDYARRVLTKHWPSVPKYGDIRTIDWGTVPRVDLLCGGFPCQPFSTASRGRRTAVSLWPEMFRAIKAIWPNWVLIENVAGAARLVFPQVAADLESIGYSVTPPLEIPACAVGFDHWRPRYWLLAHTYENGKPGMSEYEQVAKLPGYDSQLSGVGTANGISYELDRLRGLGNAVVPQIVEALGRMILESITFHKAQPLRTDTDEA